jgi:hypothetical protein
MFIEPSPQMEEYRARVCHDVPGPGSTPKPKKVNLDQFALDNDIGDMFDFSGGDSSPVMNKMSTRSSSHIRTQSFRR